MPVWLLPLLKNWKVIVVVAVAFSLFSYLQHELKETRDLIELQEEVKDQKGYIDTRKEIDDAVESTTGIDDTTALDWLRERSGKPR